MDNLPRVEPDDRRIGVSWLTKRQLAERFGLTESAVRQRLAKRGLRPVARVGRNGVHLFEMSAVEVCGAVLARSFDSASEVLLTDYARELGYTKPSTLLDALRSRLAAQLGIPSRLPTERLEEAGVARRLGSRWIVRRQAAEALLAPPYDPAREATVEELRLEHGLTSKGALRSALGGHLKGRRVVVGSGQRTLVFDREEVRRVLARRPAPGQRGYPPVPAVVRPEETWRSRVGPFQLKSPTRQETIALAEARWLLGEHLGEVSRLNAAGSDSTRSKGEAVAVACVEAELIERGDFEGLFLLARLLDGALLAGRAHDRVAAVLAATEKAG